MRDGGLGGPLVAELPGRSLEITRLGSLRQRQEAADQLNQLLGLRPAAPGDQPPAPALLALLGRGGIAGPRFWAMGIPLALVALACGWAQVWLVFGRREWRLEPRVLVLQRRFGHHLRTLGEARALELIELVDHHASDPSSLRQQLDRAEAAGASRAKQRPDD